MNLNFVVTLGLNFFVAQHFHRASVPKCIKFQLGENCQYDFSELSLTFKRVKPMFVRTDLILKFGVL